MSNKPNTSIIIYTTDDGLIKVEATFDDDTVWLSIDQMAELFQRDRSVIGKNIRNFFKEGELLKESVWANLPTLPLMAKNTIRKRRRKSGVSLFEQQTSSGRR